MGNITSLNHSDLLQEYRINSDKVPVLPAPRSLENLITTTLTRLPVTLRIFVFGGSSAVMIV